MEDTARCGRCSHPVDLHKGEKGPDNRSCLKEMGRGILCACTHPRKS
jgi:hypothetical protein